MTKLWELQQFTEADEFKTIWTITDNFEDWVMNWFYPMAQEHGFVFTDEDRQELIENNFGSGELVNDIDPSEYDDYFAEEIYWYVLGYFENLLDLPEGWGLFGISEKIILLASENYRRMPLLQIYDKAW